MPRQIKPAVKSDGAAYRYPINTRTTFELRQKLESAAISSGRSLAQEIEFRLESTFEDDLDLERYPIARIVIAPFADHGGTTEKMIILDLTSTAKEICLEMRPSSVLDGGAK